MSYTASTFIETFSGSDRVISIKNTQGKKTFALNVCKYQSSDPNNNTLVIIMEEKTITLSFTSSIEAQTAAINLGNVINTLRPNCILPNGQEEVPRVFHEKLIVGPNNTLSQLSKTPATSDSVKLVVNGQELTPLGSNPSFSVSGITLTWNPDTVNNETFDLETSDVVVAKYNTIE